MERRRFIKTVGLSTVAAYTVQSLSAEPQTAMQITGAEVLEVKEFPLLPYAYNSLEPYIDARTMEIHYDKHHRAYYNNYLAAIKGTPFENMPVNEVFMNVSKNTDAIRNNGGGFYNHHLFWNNLSSEKSEPSQELQKSIETAFGTFDKFKESFSNAAKTRFGSGWAWLYMSAGNVLAVGSTPNQDNPLMDVSPVKGIPLLTLDVWEHAYYLKYQNLRADYVTAFWNIVNWKEVNKRYLQAQKG